MTFCVQPLSFLFTAECMPLYRGSLLFMNMKQVEDKVDTLDVSHWVTVNKAATNMGIELFI